MIMGAKNIAKGNNAFKSSGDATVIEIFYYKIGTTEASSFLRISDNAGQVKYVE